MIITGYLNNSYVFLFTFIVLVGYGYRRLTGIPSDDASNISNISGASSGSRQSENTDSRSYILNQVRSL